MRLMTDVGPVPRSAGRYFGNSAGAAGDAAGVAEALAAGEVVGFNDADGFAEGDGDCDLGDGVAAGFISTWAAKKLPQPSKTAAKDKRVRRMTCLRNAVLELSQGQSRLIRNVALAAALFLVRFVAVRISRPFAAHV